MRHPSGGYYSAEDADSLPVEAGEGEKKKEGAFCVWTQAEIEKLLGGEKIEASIFPVVARERG